MATLVRWLPRVLAVAALALLLITIGPDALLEVVVWSVLLGAWRFVAAAAPTRMAKLSVDAVFLVLTAVAAFEGGWYLIPAGIAWALGDFLLTVEPGD